MMSRSLGFLAGGLFAAAAVLVAASLPTAAQSPGPTQHRVEYRVSFIGLPVAQATFTTIIDGISFSVDGNLKSAGVANIVGRTEGQSTVTGVVADDRMQASTYRLSYQSGDKEQSMAVDFQDGAVVKAVLNPQKKRTRPDWVPTDQGDLQSVLDPIAGFMLPGDADVCDRTLPLFDGETRYDVHMSEAGREPFETDGFSGEAIVCTARAEMKAGYHAENSAVEFLRTAQAEVWFAKNEAADLYAPVFARIPTKLGPVRITATRFGS